jgi:hypothetical protein
MLVMIAAVVMPPAAAAQSTDPALAETLFQDATRLFNDGKFAEACPKFAASHKADPGYGAVFNLGACDEKIGKTASAWAAFLEAAAIAKSPPEASDARQRATALEPKLVRLRIIVAKAPEGLVVKRDTAVIDRAAWGTAAPVDPGSYRIEASAPGKKTWSTTATVEGEGKTVQVEVPPLADETPVVPTATTATATTTPTQVEPPRPLGTQRGLALAAGGLGVIGLAVGGALGAVAKSKWDDAKPHCDAQHACDPIGLAEGNEARSFAQGSTGAFIAGGIVAVGGIILWLTARPNAPAPKPDAAAHVAPWIDPRGGGFVCRGSF